MPDNPRRGSSGHQSSHSEWAYPEDETGNDSETDSRATSRRRRRALGDDGTGGTRVGDLLSRHGKGQTQNTGSHRKVEADESEFVPPEEQSGPQSPRSGPREESPEQPTHTTEAVPETPPQHDNPPQAEGRRSRGRRARRRQQEPEQEQPGGTERGQSEQTQWQIPNGAGSPPQPAGGIGATSTPPAESDDTTRMTPFLGASRRPNAARSGGNAQQPAEQSSPHTSPLAPPSADRGAGNPESGAPQRPEGDAGTDTSDRTRPNQPISAALNQHRRTPAPPPPPLETGSREGGHQQVPSEEPTAQQPAVRGEMPPRAGGFPPEEPSPQPARREGTAAPESSAPSAAEEMLNGSPRSGSPVPETTTHHEGAQPERKPDTAAGGRTSGAEHDPDTTAIAPRNDSSGTADSTTSHEAAPDGDGSADEQDDDNEASAAIDATLARFSAVHDELAAEEEKRRKKYAWLWGSRKEPEPGQDMPFDFAEDRDANSSRVEWRKGKQRRRLRMLGRGAAVAVAALVFVTTGIGWGSKTWLDASFNHINALNENSDAIQDAHLQEGDQNFLLIGSDTRKGAEASDNIGTVKGVPGARSDTTMIAHIPADRSRVVIVSIPRDLEIDIQADTCRKWDSATGKYSEETVAAQQNVKFNTAFGTGGPACVTKQVQQLSGLEINSFLGVNFQGFKSMVDAVGGVQVCTNKPMIDQELGTILETAGTHKLGPQQALRYVRARKLTNDPTSDYGRMERQQLFLGALLRKMTSANVLLNPSKLGNLANAVIANTFGDNVNSDKLISLGKSLDGLDPEKVTFVTIPTTGIQNSRGNEVMVESEAHSLFRAIIEDVPLDSSSGQQNGQASEGATSDTSPMAFTQQEQGNSSAKPDPSEVNVSVFNSTERSGLAGNTASGLREFDFAVGNVGNLESPLDQTVIRYSEGNKQRAQLLASAVPSAEIVADSSVGETLRLELGTDYDNRVRKPDSGDVDVPENLSTVNAGEDKCGGVSG
ncbi:LCP family protein required for cell wall assembly [Actinopolyspora lacussalsi]|nr:LCP family protein required for cell wall assembly [Actinopolyspora lacussalsi]